MLHHAAENKADGEASPGEAVAVANERSGRVLAGKPLADVQGEIGQVDDADLLLALRLLHGKDPAFAGGIEVAFLDASDFLWPAAGFPTDGDEVAELLGRSQREHPLVGEVVDDYLALAWRRLLHVADGRFVQHPPA